MYLKDSKIRQLYCCVAVAVSVMVHDPVAKVWRAYANCGNKTVKISMPVAGDGNGNGNGTETVTENGDLAEDLSGCRGECYARPWLAALTAKQFAEISLKLNEIVKSISHILPLPVTRKKTKRKQSKLFSYLPSPHSGEL